MCSFPPICEQHLTCSSGVVALLRPCLRRILGLSESSRANQLISESHFLVEAWKLSPSRASNRHIKRLWTRKFQRKKCRSLLLLLRRLDDGPEFVRGSHNHRIGEPGRLVVHNRSLERRHPRSRRLRRIFRILLRGPQLGTMRLRLLMFRTPSLSKILFLGPPSPLLALERMRPGDLKAFLGLSLGSFRIHRRESFQNKEERLTTLRHCVRSFVITSTCS